jgi:hypothetical protein
MASEAEVHSGTPPARPIGMFGNNRGVWPAWLIMLVLSLLLGWLPFVGPAIAGWIGGMQAGSVGSAIIAALVPSLILTILVWVFGAVIDFGLVSAFVGIGLFMILVIGALPLLLGALVGGWMAGGRPSSTDAL